MDYQRMLLSTGAKVGDPGALPAALQGLGDATLANLPAAFDPCPPEWIDTGFVPVAAEATPATTLVVDVPTFLLRLLPQERVGVRASQDPLVMDFQRLLDDPRVIRINLGLPAVEGAVAYLAGQLPGLNGQPLAPPLIDPSRVPAILAPEPV